MPLISVVIPAYLTENYLPDCLKSISSQSFTDWEAVIVIDGSPDSCADIARRYAETDTRFVVLELEKNVGRHLARKRGVEACTGDYVCFLDSDDTFTPGFLSAISQSLGKMDCVFFGANVINCGNYSEQERLAFENGINIYDPPLFDRDITLRSFSPSENVRNWRLTQRIFRSSVIKTAFSNTIDTRLNLAEDVYEYFAASLLEESESTCLDIRINYNIGRGITSNSCLDIIGFEYLLSQYRDSIVAFTTLAEKFDSLSVLPYICDRFYTDLGNIWHTRLAQSDKAAGTELLAEYTGKDAAAAQLARIARDVAYDIFVGNRPEEGISQPKEWLSKAEDYARQARLTNETTFLDEFERFATPARNHIQDVANRMAIEASAVENPMGQPLLKCIKSLAKRLLSI